MAEKKSKKNSFTLEELEDVKKNMQVIDMYVESIDTNYNLIGYVGNNIKAIMPREEFSSVVNEDGLVDEKYIINKAGKTLHTCIKEIIKTDDNTISELIVSKKILEMKVRKWMYMHLKEGIKLKGVVISLVDYGAFVDVGGGVTGLIKNSDISSSNIKHPSEVFKIGQRINVIVKKYDRDTGKIELSYKEQLGTFEDNVKKIKEGDILEGTVKNRIKTGIFVEIKPGLVGLAEHVSGIEYGQKVLVCIKKINMEKQKIKLVIIG